MRTIVKLAYAVGALVMIGCSGGEAAMNDELRKDLELAWSSNAIELAGSDRNAGRQVVSAIERTARPAPRRVAPSQRVARYRPARRAPAPVEIAEAEVADEPDTQPVEAVPTPVEPAPVWTASLPSPRPRPVGGPDDGGGDIGRGGDHGRVLGGVISVVLRGGGVDGDNCDEHMQGGRRGRAGRIGGGMISINNRIPIQGTFPGRTRF